MVRIMHISDTHLGYRQYMLGERETDFYDSFERVIDLAREEHVDMIVHSGDIFETSRPPNQALKVFKDTLMRINGKIKYFAVLGDHDRPRKRDYPAPNLFDFLGIKVLGINELEHEVLHIDNKELLVAGLSNLKGIYANRILEEFKKADLLAQNFKYSIFIGHEGISTFLPDENWEVDFKELPKNFNYLAFGHLHSRVVKEYGKGYFAYAGSTELHSEDEIINYKKDGKGAYLVDLDTDMSIEKLNIDTIRPQEKIDTDAEHWIEDLKNILSIVYAKKPIIHLKISGKINASDIHSIINEQFKNSMLYYRLKLSPTIMPNEDLSTSNLKDSLTDYFKNENMGIFAYNLFELLQNDYEEAYDFILKTMERW
ncbi:MAG: exonuclease SbcCD subunit D [Thermoplasmata archaeon]